ncbi:acetyl-CoA carboxylase biotin carboxylase subunit [Advenella kashmirensis]
MLKKVLIANRGEIACRVIKACRKLGIGSVAVYSDADVHSPHVRMADESVHIGPARSAESYLQAAKILAAARQTGADGIHPGYGFLSENALFAQAVIDAGITWVGPEPQSIRNMGHKQNARELAIKAGVPVVPGSGRLDSSDMTSVTQEASRIGYPLLVKAAAGGGGIGMRQVNECAQLEAAIGATQSQAVSAFGNGDIFLEKYVARARHVEVQVFGFGNKAIHVFDRDCSLQRRFQKIIEEAPAPDIPPDVRSGMHRAAVALAESVQYQGAGTVEFIFDVDARDFYFLEMNTRIQVEHPVTEMITGLDLVAMQLLYAGGKLETLQQHEVVQQGHAIECRLYAENPDKNFMPSPGTLTKFALPDPETGIRVETGYEQGSEITPFYDPMIAKIVAHGADREKAVKSMIAALNSTGIEGLRTNKAFLIACLTHPAFDMREVSTRFVNEHINELVAPAKAA